MAQRNTSPKAGGFPIAIGAIGGTIAGLIAGQPTGGFLTGIALGIVAATAIWWIDRRR